MRRLNFHLSEDQIERLYAVASQHHISASELVRRFIDHGLARLGAPSELGDSVALADLQQQLAALRLEVRQLQARMEEHNV
jgi:hypothetical protein